jgi:hypothetical protein
MPIYKTDEQLEEIGREFLRRLGLENRPRPEPMTVIAKLKHVMPGFAYRRVPDRDMPQAEAEWDSDACEIAMRESVFTGMQRGEPHSCFVVFHELSHYCLGHLPALPCVECQLLESGTKKKRPLSWQLC